MSRKTVIVLIIAYASVTLILYNVLQTAAGAFLMTLSQVAAVFGIGAVLFFVIRASVSQFLYNRKHRTDIE